MPSRELAARSAAPAAPRTSPAAAPTSSCASRAARPPRAGARTAAVAVAGRRRRGAASWRRPTRRIAIAPPRSPDGHQRERRRRERGRDPARSRGLRPGAAAGRRAAAATLTPLVDQVHAGEGEHDAAPRRARPASISAGRRQGGAAQHAQRRALRLRHDHRPAAAAARRASTGRISEAAAAAMTAPAPATIHPAVRRSPRKASQMRAASGLAPRAASTRSRASDRPTRVGDDHQHPRDRRADPELHDARHRRARARARPRRAPSAAARAGSPSIRTLSALRARLAPRLPMSRSQQLHPPGRLDLAAERRAQPRSPPRARSRRRRRSASPCRCRARTACGAGPARRPGTASERPLSTTPDAHRLMIGRAAIRSPVLQHDLVGDRSAIARGRRRREHRGRAVGELVRVDERHTARSRRPARAQRERREDHQDAAHTNDSSSSVASCCPAASSSGAARTQVSVRAIFATRHASSSVSASSRPPNPSR